MFTRRNVIVFATATGIGAVVGVPEEADAAEGDAGHGPPRQVVTLLILVVGLAGSIWKALTPAQQNKLAGWLTGTSDETGRTVSVSDDTDSSDSPTGPRSARIHIRINKHPQGVAVTGWLHNMDGGTTPHVKHSGVAPHHEHPHMKEHLRQIVLKSHAFLRQRKV